MNLLSITFDTYLFTSLSMARSAASPSTFPCDTVTGTTSCKRTPSISAGSSISAAALCIARLPPARGSLAM